MNRDESLKSEENGSSPGFDSSLTFTTVLSSRREAPASLVPSEPSRPSARPSARPRIREGGTHRNLPSERATSQHPLLPSALRGPLRPREEARRSRGRSSSGRQPTGPAAIVVVVVVVVFIVSHTAGTGGGAWGRGRGLGRSRQAGLEGGALPSPLPSPVCQWAGPGIPAARLCRSGRVHRVPCGGSVAPGCWLPVRFGERGRSRDSAGGSGAAAVLR